MASSANQPVKKATKKFTARPATRSTSLHSQFTSDTDEVNALVRALEHHLANNVTNRDMPQLKRQELRAEIKAISEDTSKEQKTVAEGLDPLRRMVNFSKLPGSRKTAKGVWLHTDETRKLATNPALMSPESSKDPQSPNLLESPESNREHDPPEENREEEAREETKYPETKEEETHENKDETTEKESQNAETNIQTGEFASSDSSKRVDTIIQIEEVASSDSSNNSSQNEETKQTIPPQRSPSKTMNKRKKKACLSIGPKHPQQDHQRKRIQMSLQKRSSQD